MEAIEVWSDLRDAARVIDEVTINAFLQYEQDRGLAETTLRSRRYLLSALPGYDPGTVAQYAKEKGLRPGSHSHLAKCARGYCKWAERELGIKSPWREDTLLPSAPVTVGDPLTEEEVDRLRDTPVWEYCIFGLYAGLRAAEIARVTNEDFVQTVHGMQLRVVGKGGKDATIPAHPALCAYRDTQNVSGSLFPGVTAHQIVQKSRYHFRKARILRGGIHRCRATFATSVYRKSGDLVVTQHALRHSSLATTQAYLGLDQSSLHAAVTAL